MTGKAEQLYREGKLDEAITALSGHLREHPEDSRGRTFLFELLCFAGEHDRAEKHLELLGAAGQDAAVGALLYRGALNAERTRRKMFEDGDFPPGPAGAKPAAGFVNGRPFKSIEDADPRIGPRLEAFAAGTYLWIPFEHIASIQLNPPSRLRDLIWAPARIKTGPGFSGLDMGEVLIPVLCPLSYDHPDAAVRLGRVTEWVIDGTGTEFPMGLKMLAIDGEEFPILEVRNIEISASGAASVS